MAIKQWNTNLCVISLYNFYVTIWCKDNKLIIYLECGQREKDEHVLKEFPLCPAERDLLRKVSWSFILKFFLMPWKALEH